MAGKKVTKPVKYTEEFVSKEVGDILSEIKEDPTIIVLGQVFEDRDYSLQRFSEWAKKFSNDDEISESLRKIKNILETRLNVGGIQGDFNAKMTALNLTNNYGWKDKNETALTGADGGPIETKWDIVFHDADAPTK